MRTPAAVLLDLDETLFDRTGLLHAFLADQHGRFGPHLGRPPLAPWRERFLALDERGRVDKAAVYAALLAEFGGGHAHVDRLLADYHERFSRFARPFEGMASTLSALRDRGLGIGIVSNGDGGHQRRTIAALKLEPLVDVFVISGIEGVRKPDPAIFRLAAERLGVAARQCLFVGDNPRADIAGAAAAGMATVWFQSGESWPEELALRPDAAITDLSEVVRLIDDTAIDANDASP